MYRPSNKNQLTNMRKKNFCFPLLLICLIFAQETKQKNYPGISEICTSQKISQNVGWCKKHNKFSTESKFMNENKEQNLNFLPVCLPGYSSIFEEECTSITGTTTFSNENDPNENYMVLGMSTGELYMYNFNTYERNLLAKKEGHGVLNVYSFEDKYVAVVYGNLDQRVTISLYEIALPSTARLVWESSSELNRLIKNVEFIRVKKPNGQEIIKLVYMQFWTVFYHHIYFVDIEPGFSQVFWRTFMTLSGDMNFHIIKHQINQNDPRKSRNLRSPKERLEDGQAMRYLLVIHDKSSVRIFQYTDQTQSIRFTSPDAISTFYTPPTGFNIDSVSSINEKIRRPQHLQTTNCSTITFTPSQNIFLVIAESQDNAKASTVKIRHVMELSNILAPTALPGNPANRPVGFACGNGYFDPLAQLCRENTEKVFSITGKVTKMQYRFNDIEETFAGVHSYHPNGSLNANIICEVYKQVNPTESIEEYENCKRIIGTTVQCELDLLKLPVAGLAKYMDAFFYSYWHSLVFIAKDNREIDVLSQAIQFNSVQQIQAEKINTIKTQGTIHDIHVSENSHHLFTNIYRKRWELESIRRRLEICYAFSQDPTNEFLFQFNPMCIGYTPDIVDEYSFTVSSSSCGFKNYCPGVSISQRIRKIEPGYYSFRPNVIKKCPKGSYCINGLKYLCPIGYLCPAEGLDVPVECTSSKKTVGVSLGYHCGQEGLFELEKCPKGYLCSDLKSAPLLVPPGYFLEKQITQRIAAGGIAKECKRGDYCPIGRDSTDDLLCPSKTYCSTPSVMFPTICNFTINQTDYCPRGSSERRACETGSYCLNLDEKYTCNITTYCGSGSVLPSICEAGFYCQNASSQVLCPTGYYCPVGSIEPLACSWFSAFLEPCGDGAPIDHLYTETVLMMGGLLITLVMTFFGFTLFNIAYKKSVKHKFGISRKRIEGVTVKFKDLGLRLTNGLTILKQVNGEVKAGELTAVMGLSGSGKTTFITTLAGRAYSGSRTRGSQIWLNGKKADLGSIKSKIGFVTQEDIMIRTMTVEETILFSAKTRCPDMTSKEINDRVNYVIKTLGLEHVRDSFIGDEEKRGISGGERKRVNVGMELVTYPSILFLDEPTSGLDSTSAMELCRDLKNIAEDGATVITVIHQPNHQIFQKFDKLVLLQKGELVYIGPVRNMIPYFEKYGCEFPAHVNPVDQVMDFVKHSPKLLIEAWKQGSWEEEDDDEEDESLNISKSTSSFFAVDKDGKLTRDSWLLLPKLYFIQMVETFKRALVQNIRNIIYLGIDLFLLWLSGAFLGVLYQGTEYIGPPAKEISNICGPLAALCDVPRDDPLIQIGQLLNFALALVGGLAGLRLFGNETAVFKRESESGLNTWIYFFTKEIALYPSLSLLPFAMLCVIHVLFQPRCSFWELYYICILVYWVSMGVGYMVSMLVPTFAAQIAVIVVVSIFNMVNGVSPTVSQFEDMTFPMNIMPNLSYLRFSTELFYLTMLQPYEGIYDLSNSLGYFGYEFGRLNHLWYELIIFGLIFRFIALICMICSKPDSYFKSAVSFIRGGSSLLKAKLYQKKKTPVKQEEKGFSLNTSGWDSQNMTKAWFEIERYNEKIKKLYKILTSIVGKRINIKTVASKQLLVFTWDSQSNEKSVYISRLKRYIFLFDLGEDSNLQNQIEKKFGNILN